MNINKKLAKSISYGGVRDLKSIKYIVLHFTGNKGDTAKNNALFYATGNTREAGAHFFVDKKGRSEPFERKYCWQLQQVPGPEALSDLCKRIASKSV